MHVHDPVVETLTGLRGLLNHIYQNHGPQEGLRFVSRIQRLTTCVGLYGYCPSVGLDDCLLPVRVRRNAHSIIATQIERYRERQEVLHAVALPYTVDEETSTETEIDRLVKLRSESEQFITRYVLNERKKDGGSAMCSSRLNQIALFAMLATKGSVDRACLVSNPACVQPYPMLPQSGFAPSESCRKPGPTDRRRCSSACCRL